jgi:hypothetical protein
MIIWDHSKTSPEGHHFDRRGFIKVSTAAAAVRLFAGSLCSSVADAAALTREQRDQMTPEQDHRRNAARQ